MSKIVEMKETLDMQFPSDSTEKLKGLDSCVCYKGVQICCSCVYHGCLKLSETSVMPNVLSAQL